MSLLHDEQGKPSSARHGLLAVLLWVILMASGETFGWWVLSDNATQIILSLVAAFGTGAYAPKAFGYARAGIKLPSTIPEGGEADEPG